MALVNDYRLEYLYVRAEYHVFESERLPLACVNIPNKELTQAFVVDDGDLLHAHPQEIGPCGSHGVFKHQCFLVGEFLKLALPVDF